MGQKNSKKLDLFVTKDTTHCSLSENEVKKYEGRPREYTAVDVSVECYEVQKSELILFLVLFVLLVLY